MKMLKVMFLILLYLAAGMDWNVQLHFCGGDLSAVSLLNEASSCVCAEDGPMPCCDDQSVRIQASTDDQQSSLTFLQIRVPFSSVIKSQVIQESYVFACEPFLITDHNSAPPEDKLLDLNHLLRLQKLIFYA